MSRSRPRDRTGEISEVRLADGTTRYDPKIGPDHHHLLCEGCGLIFDVQPLGVEALSLPPHQRHGMTIQGVEVVFRGRCSSCAEHGRPPVRPGPDRPSRDMAMSPTAAPWRSDDTECHPGAVGPLRTVARDEPSASGPLG